MSKKIMILGASILQMPAIVQAKEMGLKVIAVDMNPQAIGFTVSGIGKELISTTDIPAIVEAAKRHKIDGIMTLATDMPMRSVAAAAKELNLTGIDEETAIKATDKAEMREALKEGNVPVPCFYRVGNEDEFLKIVDMFNSPFVIKPADSSGSRGINLIKDLEDKEQMRIAYRYSREYSRSGEVVVEEYMAGPEVSVETLSIDGECHVIQITDKITTGAPHFVEMGHTQPTRLGEKIEKRISDVAISANKAIGIKNGPSHTEIIVTAEGPKVVEIGARLGGDNITTHLVPLSTGVNMVKCCIQIALGDKPDITLKWKRGSAIRYFHQHAGVVKEIKGIEEAEKVAGIQQISIVHGIGEHITEIENSGARMGFVIAQGKDADTAERSCMNALEKINVEVACEDSVFA